MKSQVRKQHLTRVAYAPHMSDENMSVAAEWDKNAEARSRQIASGRDLSRHRVIIPAMIKALGQRQHEKLLDVGTGDGEFVARLREAHVARRYVGIDISGKMVEVAHKRFSDASTEFLVLEAERTGEQFPRAFFDVVTANMMFNTAPDLVGAIRGVGRVLTEGGLFVFSILHPRFFHLLDPLRDYIPKDFDSEKESKFTVPFTISLDPNPLPSTITYFHRPISRFLEVLNEQNFKVIDFFEPLPPEGLDPQYLARWELPRFLIITARRLGDS